MRTKIFLPTMLLAAACVEGGLPTSPPGTPPSQTPLPLLLSKVSGDNQEGVVGRLLALPLAVRVTSPAGTPLGNVAVSWSVSQGSGDFWLGPQNTKPSLTTLTASNGVTQVYFRPTVMEQTTQISAAVSGASAPLLFTAVAHGFVYVISFSPLFDCTANDPVTFDTPATVPLGSEVEWQYVGWLDPSCEAHIVSLSEPPGGAAFDSGPMRPGESFVFYPAVTGDWTFKDLRSGGTGILRVR